MCCNVKVVLLCFRDSWFCAEEQREISGVVTLQRQKAGDWRLCSLSVFITENVNVIENIGLLCFQSSFLI